MSIGGHRNVAKRNVGLTASGLMHVTKGRPFHIRIGNVRKKGVQIPKNMLVSVGGEALVRIVHMAGEEETSTSGDAESKRGGRKK